MSRLHCCVHASTARLKGCALATEITSQQLGKLGGEVRAEGLKYPAVFQQSGGTIRLKCCSFSWHTSAALATAHTGTGEARPKMRAITKWVVLAHGSEKFVSELSWCQLGFMSVVVVFSGNWASKQVKDQNISTRWPTSLLHLYARCVSNAHTKTRKIPLLIFQPGYVFITSGPQCLPETRWTHHQRGEIKKQKLEAGRGWTISSGFWVR